MKILSQVTILIAAATAACASPITVAQGVIPTEEDGVVVIDLTDETLCRPDYEAAVNDMAEERDDSVKAAMTLSDRERLDLLRRRNDRAQRLAARPRCPNPPELLRPAERR